MGWTQVHTDVSMKMQLYAHGSRHTHTGTSCHCIHTCAHTAVVHTHVHTVAETARSADPG